MKRIQRMALRCPSIGIMTGFVSSVIVMTIAEIMKFESCKASKVFGQWVRFFSKNITSMCLSHQTTSSKVMLHVKSDKFLGDPKHMTKRHAFFVDCYL